MPDEKPEWVRGWLILLVFGAAYQIAGLFKGVPLTGVARRWALARSGGSALIGGFLTWWSYHWLFDPGPGVGALDTLALIVGAGLGWVGWMYRERKKAGA